MARVDDSPASNQAVTVWYVLVDTVTWSSGQDYDSEATKPIGAAAVLPGRGRQRVACVSSLIRSVIRNMAQNGVVKCSQHTIVQWCNTQGELKASHTLASSRDTCNTHMLW